MAPDLDKLRQQQGVTSPVISSPQAEVEVKPVVSQPIDFSEAGSQKDVPKSGTQPIDMTGGSKTSDKPMVEISAQQEKVVHVVKKGDTLWNLARDTLMEAGIAKPTNTQIVSAMEAIVKNNDCANIKDFTSKFFNRIGTEIDMTGLSVVDGKLQYVEPVKSQPSQQQENTSVLSEEERQILESLKAKYPDLKLDKMSDAEMKKMLDNLKENKPELFADSQTVEAPQVVQEGEQEVPKFIQEYFGENEITKDALQSDDFKTKMTEYMEKAPDVEAAQLAKYIAESLPDDNANVLVSVDPAADNMRSAIEKYIAANPEVLNPEPAVVPKSEMEVLAEQTGIEGSFDEVIARIIDKNPEDLTKVEAELLSKYRAASNLSEKEQTLVQIARQVFESGIMDKTPEEQLQMLAQMYLKGDEAYNSMSPEDKKAKFDQTVKLLAQLAETGDKFSNKSDNFQNKIEALRAMVIVGIAKKEGISLEEMQQMPTKQRESMLKQVETQVINDYLELVMKNADIESAGKLTGKQKLDKYADTILSILDKDYNKLNDKEKAVRRKESINKLAKNLDFNDFDYEKAEERVLLKLINTLEGVIEYSRERKLNIIDVMEDFSKYNEYDKSKIEWYALKRIINPTPDEQRLIDKHVLMDRIFDGVSLGEEQTTGEVFDRVNELLKNPEKLTPQQLDFLKLIARSLERQTRAENGKGRNSRFISFFTNKDKALMKGVDPDGQNVVNVTFEGKLTKDNFESEEMLAIHAKYLDRANKEELNNYIFYARKLGVSDSQIYAMIKKCVTDEKLLEMASWLDDPAEMTDIVSIGCAAGIKDGTATILHEVSGWGGKVSTNEAISGYLKVAGEDEMYATATMSGVHEYKGKESVVAINLMMANSDDVSEACKANVSYAAVYTAPDNETKLYVCRETSSKTSNSSTLEGLAAASSSVSDSNMRDQYNSYVTTAASNLPPEDQSRINTAMQTGEISKETQSKTSTSSSSSSQSSSDKTDTKSSAKSGSKSQDTKKAESKQPAAQNQQPTTQKQQSAKAATVNQPTAKKTAEPQNQTPQPAAAKTASPTASQPTVTQPGAKNPQVTQTKDSNSTSGNSSSGDSSSSTTYNQSAAPISTASVSPSSPQVQGVSTSTSASASIDVFASTVSDLQPADNDGQNVEEQETIVEPGIPAKAESAVQEIVSGAVSQITGGSIAAGLSAGIDASVYVDAGNQIIQEFQTGSITREEVLAKIEQFRSEIQASIAEWENRHRKLTTEEGEIIDAFIVMDPVIEAINSSSLDETEKKALFEQVSKASSIDEIYEILITRSVNLSSVKEKVIDLLGSSSSTESVRNVVTELIGDDDVVKELFKRSSSTSVKKELLNMMSTDAVVELLASKQIKNLGDVDHKILRSYVEKNIYSMSNADFNEYLKHLPLDDRLALVDLRNKEKGNNKPVVLPVEAQGEAVNPVVDEENAGTPPNNVFKPNERRTTLADGTEVTKDGTSFGAVSDNDYDIYQVVQPKKKDEGAPIVTVGSAEWNLKYNRNNVQTTAFTLNAMDEDEDYEGGLNLGSVKGNFKGRTPKKKGPFGRFNAMG